MITSTQAADFLDQTLGVKVPAYLLQAALDAVEALEPAMVTAGYSEPTQIRLQSMAVAIIAAPGAPRRIKDQRAPSGASRGFDNEKDALSALRRALADLDTAGVLTDLIGADPAANNIFLVAA